MADENNKLNAELRKVEDDLFAADDFSAKEPVPLDNAMKPVEQPDFVKPLPVADEDLSPLLRRVLSRSKKKSRGKYPRKIRRKSVSCRKSRLSRKTGRFIRVTFSASL